MEVKFRFPALKHRKRTSEAHGIHEILKDGNRIEPTNGEAIPGDLPERPRRPIKGLGLRVELLKILSLRHSKP